MDCLAGCIYRALQYHNLRLLSSSDPHFKCRLYHFRVADRVSLYPPPRKPDAFEVAKTETLCVGRFAVVLTAIGFFSGYFIVVALLILLLINFLEAFVFDIVNKNYWSAITAIVLMSCCFSIQGVWQDNSYLYTNPLPLFMFAYAIWNVNFVFLQYGQALGLFGVFVQLVPLVACFYFFDTGYWIAFRGLSLTIGVAAHITFKEIIQVQYASSFLSRQASLFSRSSTQCGIALIVIILSVLYHIQAPEGTLAKWITD